MIPLTYELFVIPILTDRYIIFVLIPIIILISVLIFEIKKIDFQKCINDKEIEDLVLNERIEASKKYKIQSTPTVVINEKKFDKPLNYKNLKKTLEKLI